MSDTMTEGCVRITEERNRQIRAEGYTPEHDAEHEMIELSVAAVRYAAYAGYQSMGYVPAEEELPAWPWDAESWKPSDDPVRNLEKAGALIAAEIDRLTRD